MSHKPNYVFIPVTEICGDIRKRLLPERNWVLGVSSELAEVISLETNPESQKQKAANAIGSGRKLTIPKEFLKNGVVDVAMIFR